MGQKWGRKQKRRTPGSDTDHIHPEKMGFNSIGVFISGTMWGENHRGVGGWASEGWTASDAADLRSEFQRNKKTGEGPRTLAEKRELEDQRRESEKKAQENQTRLDVSFKSFFDDTYYPDAKNRWKTETARKAEEQVVNWIDPVTGTTPMNKIGLEHVKKNPSQPDQNVAKPTDPAVCLSNIRHGLGCSSRLGNC